MSEAPAQDGIPECHLVSEATLSQRLVAVPVSLIRDPALSPWALRVLLVTSTHYEQTGSDSLVFDHHALAHECGCSPKVAERGIAELLAAGYLGREAVACERAKGSGSTAF